MDKEKLKIEALNRMKKMELMKECIDAFNEKNDVWVSEYVGILFNLNSRPEIKEIINEFEDKYDSLVYHAILSRMGSNTHLSLMYVASSEEGWGYDREDLKYNRASCYVYDLTDPKRSETGCVGFEPKDGGLIRTY